MVRFFTYVNGHGDWDEYPATHAVFKFGRLEDPDFLHITAKLTRSEPSIGVSLHEVTKTHPKFSGLEERTEYQCYLPGSFSLSDLITKTIEAYNQKIRDYPQREGIKKAV